VTGAGQDVRLQTGVRAEVRRLAGKDDLESAQENPGRFSLQNNRSVWPTTRSTGTWTWRVTGGYCQPC
jgi:hypothetical protein